MDVWDKLLGPKLETKDGSKSTQEALKTKKIVGLYFSAHWCPPCNSFTPILSEFYEHMTAAHQDFEIVFISSDSDDKSFQSYYEMMPFSAVPFIEVQRKRIAGTFVVNAIPTLIFLDGNARVVEKEGRALVANLEGSVDDVWEKLIQKVETAQ
uniref:Nucleoredoxin putative n=1 Tax=Albugo laibachii Nc14 TaxID=890382 RepID=F0WBS1_9STRA|nr:nucleoredoxin putative [Albugo laibachii Nc14]CCA20555.1 nucleoredoxin putative [Albugo laibachii Nc14]|eukprot:CCA20555.1 nucleoredoxin putative [Albugo laibachii Nc14]